MLNRCCCPQKKLLREKFQVLVLTNYRQDKQHSMLRFGNLLTKEFKEEPKLELEEIYPKSLFFGITPSQKLKKWAAYIDKYLIFPQTLKNRLSKHSEPIDLVHIIDHSNAPYLKVADPFINIKKIITCHDLIAIRTARGEFDRAPMTSITGKHLQKLIYKSLLYSDHYPCDSYKTQEDLNQLFPSSRSRSSVIHLSTENASRKKFFRPVLGTIPFDPTKNFYLLHVGSSAWYKNRKGVILAFRHLCEQNLSPNAKLVLVGPRPNHDELGVKLFGWLERNQTSLCILEDLPEASLHILYKHANALIFPSYIEGFGWPPLEAAIRKCPVITFKTGAIYDLLGDYAHYVDPTDQESINQSVVDILRSKQQVSQSISLPDHHHCREEYHKLYTQMLKV